ncbi:hypothetical protein BGX30_013270 [Mortierella sp. GBA39]|nr:hypothetical protein BGX30_013270 [Mortierella sp. GBA39]
MVSSGTPMTLGWTLTTTDSYMYDSLSALIYCMDYSGPELNIWREIGTLFSNAAIWPTSDFTFKLPECGPRVGATAVRMVAQGWGGVFYDEDACVFSVDPMEPQVTPSPTPNSFKMPPPTTTLGNPLLQPTTNTLPPPPTNTAPLSIAPTNLPTEGITTSPIVTSSTNTASTAPSLNVGSGTETSSSGGTGDSGSAFSPAVQTSFPPLPPLPTFPNGGGISPPIGPTAEKHDSSQALKATLLSVGVFACVAAVVVPLLVMRRRRMRRNRKLASRSEELISGGAAPGTGGGAGAVMKEKKRRLGHKPKEGYFYKMEDEEEGDCDNDDMQQSSGDLEKQYAALAMTASASAAATASDDGTTETRDRSMAVGAGVGQLDAVTVPQMALLGDTTTATSSHKRRSSLSYMVTSHYTMSSLGDGSSISGDDSSVVRKYWAASMAARTERRLEGHSPIHGLEDGSDSYGYDEGSIFGDQSRDSDSRMADILSLRTTGSVDGTAGGTMDTTRHRLYEQYQLQEPYRRDTLNTSFGDGISTRTMTLSLSSAQDSCPFSEEEFLERMHFEQLQTQLQHEYYARQQREHHQNYHHHSETESMMSRRTSSVPSLTSTNDPFKTFDSNEIVLDQDQDQEQHQHHSEDPFADSRRCTPSPEPSLRVPTMDRSNSDLVGSFPHSP